MIAIKTITSNETYAIRHHVLRKGRPIEDCVFKDDDLETTLHLGLFINSKLIGVVSYMKTTNNLLTKNKQYQLRGMAILKGYQGKKYGNLFIKHAEDLLRNQKTKIIWCNAREVAVNFYKRNGFTIIGKPFDIPKIGTHFIVYKHI